MREKILATLGIISVFGLLACTNIKWNTNTQLILFTILTPWIFVLYSRTIVANNGPLLPKESTLKFFGLTHIFWISLTFILLFFLKFLANSIGILANQVYLILDLNNKIPFLRYNLWEMYYREVASLTLFLFIINIIFAVFAGLFGLVCFSKNLNEKGFQKSFLTTIKYTMYNFKFWAIFIPVGILMLFYPWLLIKLCISAFHTLILPVLITLLITPYLVKWLFPQILENKFEDKEELKQGYKKLGIIFLIVITSYALLYFANKYTFKLVENKLPPVVKNIRMLETIDSQHAYRTYAEFVIKNYPNDYRTYELMGEYYSRGQNYKSAIKYYEKAIKLAPNLVRVNSYALLYEAYEAIGQQRPDILVLGLKYHPKSFLSNYLNKFYMDNKNLVDCYKNSDNSGIAELLMLQALLNASKHFDKAVELESKIKKAENEEHTKFYLKNVIDKEQIFLTYQSILFAQIVAPLETVPSQITKHATIQNLIAQGKVDEVLKIIDKDKDIYYYAEAIILKNNFDEAQKYLDIQPNIKSQLKLLLKKKDYKELFRYYKSLPTEKQETPEYKKLYIVGLYETGQYKKAIKIGEQAADKLWYDADFFETMKNCYEEINNKAKTKEYEEKINELKKAFD